MQKFNFQWNTYKEIQDHISHRLELHFCGIIDQSTVKPAILLNETLLMGYRTQLKTRF